MGRQKLLDTRKLLQFLLKNTSDMVFAADLNGALVLFNSGGEKMLGYGWEEVANRPIREFAVDPSGFDQLTAVSQKKEQTNRMEVPFRHKTGRTIYCDVSLSGLADAKGHILGTVGICRDITRWKNLQEDLIRVDRLAEIGRTASSIVHEINNPCAVIGEISGWIGTVAGDAKDLIPKDREEILRAVQDIKEQTKRCGNITRQLLSFARDSAPSRASVDIHKLLLETVAFVNPELKYEEIEVVLNLIEGPLILDSDKQLLEQVVVNLLSNALYAVKEKKKGGGRIEIGTERMESVVEIRISDNGTGISEENQNRMYELFFTTKPPGKGTGLGLPICRNIIQKLGGNLTFKTEAGDGTTFCISLPVS